MPHVAGPGLSRYTVCRQGNTGQSFKFTRMRFVTNEEGQSIVLTRNGEISILDAKGREQEKYEVPTGAVLQVNENDEVKAGAVLCQWDPHSIPILAEVPGRVRYEDIVRLTDAGGRPISVWGCVSVVSTLPHGTAEDVRRAVERSYTLAGMGRGFVLSSTSSVMPEVPHENIDALFRHGREFGRAFLSS